MPEKPVPLVHVVGSIRDRGGAGVPDVSIRIIGRGVSAGVYESAVTDSAGAFTIALAEGRYDVIIDPGFGSGLVPVLLERMAISAKVPRIDYQYTGILVQGNVSVSTGISVDSGFVSLEYYDYDYSGGGLREYLHNGSFAFLAPGPGTYELRVISWTPPIPGDFSKIISVTADTTIQVHIDAFLVSGTIFSPEGTALSGATIFQETGSYFPYPASGSDGGYRIWMRGSGGRLVVRPPNNMSFVLPRITPFITASGPTTIDISLDGMRWRGAVRSSADSSVIPSVTVAAYLVADDYHRSARDVTDSNGGFELVLEPRKEYDLSVTTPAGEKFVARSRFADGDSTFDVYVDPWWYGGP